MLIYRGYSIQLNEGGCYVYKNGVLKYSARDEDAANAWIDAQWRKKREHFARQQAQMTGVER